MGKEKLISVIVPVYNAEKYLKKCIESIIGQTYKSLEIILIDDCSKDKSLEICRAYAKKDRRIKVLRNEKNLGQAGTRNIGLDNANGDYIGFVDNDDWLDERFFDVVLENLKKNNVLVSGCATATYHGSGEISYNRADIASGIMDSDKLINEILFSDPVRWGTVWNKIFDKSLKKDLYFLPNHELEDYYVMIKIFSKCKKVYFDNRGLYNYNCRTNSQSRRGYHDNILTEKDTCKKIRQLLESDKKFKDGLDFFEFDVRYNIITLMYKNTDKIQKSSLENELLEMKKESKNFNIRLSYSYLRKRMILAYIAVAKNFKEYGKENI